MMFEKRRYSVVYIYKGGHEAWPGHVEEWTRKDALEKAKRIAASMPVVPRDVQLLHDFGVVETIPTIGELGQACTDEAW